MIKYESRWMKVSVGLCSVLQFLISQEREFKRIYKWKLALKNDFLHHQLDSIFKLYGPSPLNMKQTKMIAFTFL